MTVSKYLLSLTGLLAGLVFTVWVSFVLYRAQADSIDHDFSAMVNAHAHLIESEMALNAEALYSLKALFDSSEEVTAEEFRSAANDLLLRHEDILSFEWIPRVVSTDRKRIEEELMSRALTPYFTELLPNAELTMAGEREHYFPTLFIEPSLRYTENHGFDHLSDPTRAEVIAKARDSDSLIMSPILKSIRHDQDDVVILALPIYRGTATTLENRRNSFTGIVAATIHLEQLIHLSLHGDLRRLFFLQLIDGTNDRNRETLYSYGKSNATDAFTEELELIGGRNLLLIAGMDPTVTLQRKAFMPVLVLIAGMALFGTLTMTLTQLNRQKKQIEKQVADRTRRLDEANKKLSLLSTTDELTGLENRRSAFGTLDREWQRHARDKMKLSILMIDIDHFKEFNDTYGHLTGDECLRNVATLLSTKINRPADLIARYGGEEFIAILPNTDEESETLAERCRKSLESLHIPHENSPVSEYVTISIGVATALPDEVSDYPDLIDKADSALYQAKAEGRNRVCKYQGRK